MSLAHRKKVHAKKSTNFASTNKEFYNKLSLADTAVKLDWYLSLLMNKQFIMIFYNLVLKNLAIF